MPIYVRDVAAVSLESPVPSGIYSKDRVTESIQGIVLMRRGENPSQVLARIKQTVDEVNATMLPAALPRPGPTRIPAVLA